MLPRNEFYHRTVWLIAIAFIWIAPKELGGLVQAATLYWDTDGATSGNDTGTGANLGGTGVWSTTDSNWWNGASGTLQPWSDGVDAIFWGTPGTVSVSSI